MEHKFNENVNDILFGGNDFVFTRAMDPETGEYNIVGGGYTVNSALLSLGIPIMETLNLNNNLQTGGKVSSPFENLAVPAGLFYVNQQIYNNLDTDTHKQYNHYNKHETTSDDIIEKLYGLVNSDIKRQRKTKKNINKLDNNNKTKTRKHR